MQQQFDVYEATIEDLHRELEEEGIEHMKLQQAYQVVQQQLALAAAIGFKVPGESRASKSTLPPPAPVAVPPSPDPAAVPSAATPKGGAAAAPSASDGAAGKEAAAAQDAAAAAAESAAAATAALQEAEPDEAWSPLGSPKLQSIKLKREPRIKPKSWTISHVCQIYYDKIVSDLAGAATGTLPKPFVDFIWDWHVSR